MPLIGILTNHIRYVAHNLAKDQIWAACVNTAIHGPFKSKHNDHEHNTTILEGQISVVHPELGRRDRVRDPSPWPLSWQSLSTTMAPVSWVLAESGTGAPELKQYNKAHMGSNSGSGSRSRRVRT